VSSYTSDTEGSATAAQRLGCPGPSRLLELRRLRNGVTRDLPRTGRVLHSLATRRARRRHQVLKESKAAGERVLVFIEYRDMQVRSAEVVRHMFGHQRIDVINGDTPIPHWQAL
jgi:hypothetical protein